MCFSVIASQDIKRLQQEFDAELNHQAFKTYLRRSKEEPRRFPELKDRIFQNSYAIIVHKDDNANLVISPMRYGVYEPAFIQNPKIAKAFNARRDNLHAPYWSESFSHYHGMILLKSFYECVTVSKLVKAGTIGLREVEKRFQEEVEARKAKIIAAGKKYAVTATEKKDPVSRKTIIKFEADDGYELCVPVLFTKKTLDDGDSDYGFAIVTDQPQREVLAAGHDRSPSFVTRPAILDWLEPDGKSAEHFQKILNQKPSKFFKHSLEAV